MNHKNRELLRYIILFILLGIGIWEIQIGKSSYGSGLLGAAIFVFIVSSLKQRRIRQAQNQGMNPMDERTWAVAGKAAYAAYMAFVLLAACIVLLGSIWGPQNLVNPYDLLGICLAILVMFYICFYYYYNQKL